MSSAIVEKIARLPLPTLPGWRAWYDVYFYAGWRIQHNELTGSYRVVAPTSRKWRTLDESTALNILQERRDRGLKPRNDHLVIIVPGLNNVLSTFSAIEKGLKERGYEVLLWNFASNRTNTRGHAKRLAALINRLEDVKKISFVAHSLGGLILRTMFSEDHVTKHKFELGHIANIASPHGGSFVADYVRDDLKLLGLFDWVCGHVGHDLTTAGAKALPEMKVPVGVIMGGVDTKLGLNPLAGQDNDIVVSKESATIDLAVDSIQVKGSHTLMLWRKETVNQTISFIETGSFQR